MKHVDHSTKAQYVLQYRELKSPIAVQRKFRNEFGQDPPHTNSMKRCFKNFMETGSILDRKRSGRPSIDEDTVDAVRVAFHRSPKKSIRAASNELAIPRSIVHKFYVIDFGFMLTSYKLFKLLSRMITLAEQLLLKKFFSALTMTILEIWLLLKLLKIFKYETLINKLYFAKNCMILLTVVI